MSKSYTTSGAEYVTKNTKGLFIFSDNPLSTEEVAERLNDMLQDTNIPLLTAKALEKWLADTKLISATPGIANKKATDDGKRLGITCDGKNVRLDKNGQIFIVSFINYITGYIVPGDDRVWNSDDNKALVYLIKKSISFNSIPLILKVSFSFVTNKYFDIKDSIPSHYRSQTGSASVSSVAVVIKAESRGSPNEKTSLQNTVPLRRCAACRSCMLYRNETCFGREKLCEDYKPAPDLSSWDISNWPKYGDATRFKLGEKPPSD